ncbi:MAG: prepilin peptidase [Lachnospiraceae bacterium]|jgi:Flp pilus assembly protein protease CpaA|nr:prepilin peptidase [Lachnospiraceae bacterium]
MKTYFLVYIFLVPAAVSDFRKRKIKNIWILLALAIAFFLAVFSEGMRIKDLPILLLRLVWPLLFFYPFFLCGGIGAGDVKLLAALSVAFRLKDMLVILFLTFLPAAVFSLGRLIRTKQFSSSLLRLFQYAGRLQKEGFSERYAEPGQGERLPLAPFLLAGYTVFLLAELWGIL